MDGTIVVGTDGSATASAAVDRAAELAARLGVRLLIVSAFRPLSLERLRTEQAQAPEEIAYALNARGGVDEILEVARDRAEKLGAGAVEVEAIDAAPAEAILDAAAAAGASLIVVGNQGMTGARRFLLGSVPNRIAHHAPCDVLIVKTDQALEAS